MKLLLKHGLGFSTGLSPVVTGHNQLRQRLFGIHGVSRLHAFQIFRRQQFVVSVHQRIADRHDLAEHLVRVVLQRNIIAEALAHLTNAVGSLQERHGDDDLRVLPIVTLQVPSHQKVEFLIGTAQFDVGLERDGIIPLDQRIHELVDADRLPLRVPLVKVFPLQHASHGVVRAQFDQPIGRHRTHPTTVELHLCFLRVQNLEDLALVRLGVLQHLFLRQRNTRLRPPRRIANHTGEVTDQKDDLMPEVLKVFQLVDQDGVTEMQVRSRGIEARLDPQRSLFLDRASQL